MEKLREGNYFPHESFAEYADHSLDKDDIPYDPLTDLPVQWSVRQDQYQPVFNADFGSSDQ
jgi:hypothetical protein